MIMKSHKWDVHPQEEQGGRNLHRAPRNRQPDVAVIDALAGFRPVDGVGNHGIALLRQDLSPLSDQLGAGRVKLGQRRAR